MQNIHKNAHKHLEHLSQQDAELDACKKSAKGIIFTFCTNSVLLD